MTGDRVNVATVAANQRMSCIRTANLRAVEEMHGAPRDIITSTWLASLRTVSGGRVAISVPLGEDVHRAVHSVLHVPKLVLLVELPDVR